MLKELAAAGKDLIEVEKKELEPSLGNGGFGRVWLPALSTQLLLGFNGDVVLVNTTTLVFQLVLLNSTNETILQAHS